MKSLKLFLFSLIAMVVIGCDKEQTVADYGIIPLPQETQLKEGAPFVLSADTKIVYPAGNEDLKRIAHFLVDYVKFTTNAQLSAIESGNDATNAIILSADLSHENKDAYNLTITDKQIVLKGASATGVFYGVQTLRKSMDANSLDKDIAFPQVVINDYPRFQYRGMMLDVARHMFPVEFIKEFIDLLALHNMNTFHWHITDDQGWRIEIKNYPELTEKGSQRAETVIKKNTGKFDGKPYGGFYTQAEAKEIVAYAQERFINVIPEVDLPGHMLGALTAYPHLGCTGGPYAVEGTWGVFDDVLCAGNDEVLVFLKDVFTEIMEIFPSQYIHVGGDECPKVRWEKCPKCQAKIKELGLKSDKAHSKEERFQSYIISEVEKFINSKGRSIIGWDEILEGGLAPNATVMSWRGIEGGVAAAQQNHDVIMVPTSHFYFDYYQTTDIDNAPFGIGGYVPIEKVYSFDPVFLELTTEQSKHILGVQANLWTEYVKSPEHAEYMLLPRMDALTEVQWTDPKLKNYDQFEQRLLKMMKYYDRKKYNYATTIFDIKANIVPDTKNNNLNVELVTLGDEVIHYTLDGSEPTKESPIYSEIIKIDKPLELKAESFREGEHKFKYSNKFEFSKSTVRAITLNPEPTKSYTFNGAITLVDGSRGNPNNYKDGSWIGFYGQDVEATIDLKEDTEFSTVKVGTYICTGDWIFGLKSLTVLTSTDGEIFKQVDSQSFEQPTEHVELAKQEEITFASQNARYVRIVMHTVNALPKWHSGAGKKAYLFLDEIIVD